jgi:hypothetical protein
MRLFLMARYRHQGVRRVGPVQFSPHVGAAVGTCLVPALSGLVHRRWSGETVSEEVLLVMLWEMPLEE